jgi:hypothetical protein
MSDTITATIAKPVSAGRFDYERKELVRAMMIVAHDPAKGFRLPVTTKFWMGRSRNASRVYCTMRSGNETVIASGSGWAGGYGYDKESAALDDAIRNAGITLSRSISGTGECRQALEAVARALGYAGDLLTVEA